MTKIILKDAFNAFEGFTVADTARLIAIGELVSGLLHFKQFQNDPHTEEDYAETTYSLDNLLGLNDLLSSRIKISINHEMPEILYIHVAGSADVRKRAFERLDKIDDDLNWAINNHLELPYFRTIYIDEGPEHSRDFLKSTLGARGSRPLPPASTPSSVF